MWSGQYGEVSVVKVDDRPSLFVGYIHKGHKRFEVIPEPQYGSLLKKLLLEKKVHPGAIFISQMTLVHWIDPDYHKGRKDVNIYDFWKEIENLKSPDAYYKPLPLKKEVKKETPKSNYGYISPDGRYFQCDYYGHSSLEREIVGKLEKIDNPQQYLYDHRWLCIYHDPFGRGQYAIAMGSRKHMTNEQLAMLDRLKIPHTSHGFQDYLLGDE